MAKENEGRNKCSICHEISKKAFVEAEKPLDGEKPQKPITHQTIEDGRISCNGCHFGVTRVKIDVKKEFCAECHIDKVDEYTKKMEGKDGGKIMHEAHVIKQTARCYHCHPTIGHKSGPLLEAVAANCAKCHPKPHAYQAMLIAGEGGRGVNKNYPIKHHDVKLICLGCHEREPVEGKEAAKEYVKVYAKTCVDCHLKDKDKENMFQKWKEDVQAELVLVKELEKKTLDAIESAKGKASAKSLNKALSLVKDGQYNIRVVQSGRGVHNKKYSMLLLAKAGQYFEEAAEELKQQ